MHDLVLLDGDGEAHPLTLAPGGQQSADVALLAFDGCAQGTTAGAVVNEHIAGNADEGEYVGLQLTLGVPEALNHLNLSGQPAPLNSPLMHWGWTDGYKFMRLDGVVEDNSWRLHLGSVGCTGSASQGTVECAVPNRSRVTIEGLDPDDLQITLDLARLLRGVDLASQAGAPGCMSDVDDPDCDPLYDALGLPFGDRTTADQRFMQAGSGAP